MLLYTSAWKLYLIFHSSKKLMITFMGTSLSAEPHSHIFKTLKISFDIHHVSAENQMRAVTVLWGDGANKKRHVIKAASLQ